ncbi:MAG: DsrE family protein [Bryobacteraceae bacterium]|nr:DsrE family protein [Bryobacteraceae bacterium]
MTVLIAINDAPYSGERPYNAIRVATAFAADEEVAVRLFFLGDGAWCAVAGQPVPVGRHNIEWTLRRYLAAGHPAAVCGACMDERGIRDENLLSGTYRGALQEFVAWTKEADRVLVF